MLYEVITGTLFLDEIGDMPLHLQARLLRVLEEREVTPLGGEKPIKVSLKLISATHHDIRVITSYSIHYTKLYDWEEALEFAAGGLRALRDQQGPAALAGFGSAKGSNEEAYLFQKLVRTGFGSNNVVV